MSARGVNLDLFGGPERAPGPLATPRRRQPVDIAAQSRRPRWWHLARPYAVPEDAVGLFRQFMEALGGGALGLERALDLAEALGGTKQYVPERPDAHHPLVGILGAEAAYQLGAALGCADRQIPTGERSLLHARRRLIRDLYQELGSVAKVAIEVGLGESTVRESL